MLNKYINQIIQGDCLEVMRGIPDKSVDMILCDLPYGTTACKWDTVIPFEPLWAHYRRLIKDNGAIVLMASQPFTTSLIASNMTMFKYCWVWEKTKAANFPNAPNMPLKLHEDICVFSLGTCANGSSQRMTYNPQGVRSVNKIRERPQKYEGEHNYKRPSHQLKRKINIESYPSSIIKISSEHNPPHPTQKPVALFEYLIATYTQPGEIVLDNCIGSGTTAIAALNTGRFFIGIEKEPQYVEIARKRLEQAQAQQSLFA